MNPTAEQVINAYGGADLWMSATTIEAEVSVWGWAFILKGRPYFKHATITMDIAHPFSRLTPIGRNPQITGVLDGHDVRLEDDQQGTVISQRADARRYFPGGRRLLWWDDLDMAYFANYAFWNYFTLPALLMRDDIDWREIEPGTLEATFPASFPTHNSVQRFRFDPETGLLIQHDYTAEIISRLATAAHVIHAHTQGTELVYPSRRIVTPRAPSGKALPGPTLIDITVHDFHVTA